MEVARHMDGAAPISVANDLRGHIRFEPTPQHRRLHAPGGYRQHPDVSFGFRNEGDQYFRESRSVASRYCAADPFFSSAGQLTTTVSGGGACCDTARTRNRWPSMVS